MGEIVSCISKFINKKRSGWWVLVLRYLNLVDQSSIFLLCLLFICILYIEAFFYSLFFIFSHLFFILYFLPISLCSIIPSWPSQIHLLNGRKMSFGKFTLFVMSISCRYHLKKGDKNELFSLKPRFKIEHQANNKWSLPWEFFLIAGDQKYWVKMILKRVVKNLRLSLKSRFNIEHQAKNIWSVLWELFLI